MTHRVETADAVRRTAARAFELIIEGGLLGSRKYSLKVICVSLDKPLPLYNNRDCPAVGPGLADKYCQSSGNAVVTAIYSADGNYGDGHSMNHYSQTVPDVLCFNDSCWHPG